MNDLNEEDVVIYRRRMPHWRLLGSIYFATWRLAPSQHELSTDERGVTMSALNHFAGSRYELYACVIMDNHVHVLVKPLETYSLQKLVHSWKSFTAHKFSQISGRRAPIWQEDYFDRIIRDEKEFLDKAQYIINNPLKRWPEEKIILGYGLEKICCHEGKRNEEIIAGRAGVPPAGNKASMEAAGGKPATTF